MSAFGLSPLQQLFESHGAAELVLPDATLSATALHYGANDWSRALRRAGITRGDRVLAALPNGAAFVQLLVATLADGITLVPVRETRQVSALLDAFDARVAVTSDSTEPFVAVPNRTGGPPSSPITPRRGTTRTEDAAFILGTAGTTGATKWIVLSDANVMAVLSSHVPMLQVDGASVLATLPWTHVFGLVLDLLPAMLRARRIVVAPPGAASAGALLDLAGRHAITHMDMVPLIAGRLAATPEGLTLLRALRGGIVGGAPIDSTLAGALTGTRLRVGYGQTEASPGIMLGEPGEFHAGILGRPIGCAVRIESDGVLAFRGPNACLGTWSDGAMVRDVPDRWHRTDDVVSGDRGVYTFVGRRSAMFKLANGRMIVAPPIEAMLRERFPALTEVLVTATELGRIGLHYSTAGGQPLPDAALREALGGLASYFAGAILVRAEDWHRTGKGTLIRQVPSRGGN